MEKSQTGSPERKRSMERNRGSGEALGLFRAQKLSEGQGWYQPAALPRSYFRPGTSHAACWTNTSVRLLPWGTQSKAGTRTPASVERGK